MNNYKIGISTRGKRYSKNSKLHLKTGLFTQITLVLVFCVIVGTVAYLIKQNSIKNQFVMGEVKTDVIESFDANNNIKQDVSIKNIGNVPCYIRATITISWKDKDGNILEGIPKENEDYSIKFSESSNWLKRNDGYYYYKTPIEPSNSTDILIEECRQIKEYEDRTLEVSIVNQAIQSNTSKAVKEAWKIEMVDDIIVLKE